MSPFLPSPRFSDTYVQGSLMASPTRILLSIPTNPQPKVCLSIRWGSCQQPPHPRASLISQSIHCFAGGSCAPGGRVGAGELGVGRARPARGKAVCKRCSVLATYNARRGDMQTSPRPSQVPKHLLPLRLASDSANSHDQKTPD